jgi:hypothetical protein
VENLEALPSESQASVFLAQVASEQKAVKPLYASQGWVPEALVAEEQEQNQ